LLPVMAPPLALAMGLHSAFLSYGLADSTFGVMLAHVIPAAPYCTLMLASSFSRIDLDYEAVARTLGASPWGVWRHIILPALAPGLAVAAAFAFLISWSQYLLTLLVGGAQTRTLPLYLVSFQRSGDDAVSAALTLVFLAPAMLVFAVVSRFLRENK
jgi:putative spermidine/putrescine transport system permease protein